MERFWKLAEKYEDNVVYRINSACMYRSLLLRLPDTAEEQFMLIGPYMLAELSREMILDIAELISFPQDQYRRLEQFYMGLPKIADESVLLSAMNTFGECIWGSMDNFRLRDINSRFSMEFELADRETGSIAAEEPRQVMKILEERYEGENRLIQAVAKGQAHRKETGKTLTEYVTGKRIEHAVFLLNSTRLQIQSIAQRCGMSDVNYFTRLFKSLVGKTPKEYRDSIYGRGSETSGHK